MQTDKSFYSRPVQSRLVSIDVFRGLTMLLMLFVNDIGDIDLGHIQNAPWWLKHMPGKIDGMTIADVIFPCFLFIVGMAIPMALGQRISAGESLLKISRHIITRALALIFIGLCMVNSCHGYSNFDVAAMGMSGTVWRLLMFAGVIIFWSRYPGEPDTKRKLGVALRVMAAILLVYLLVIFRVNQDGASIWLRPRWWGIIGVIGWAYLFSAFIWLLCRKWGFGLIGVFVLLVSMNIGLRYGMFGWWNTIVRAAHGWVPGLAGIVANVSMVVAGMTVALLYRHDSAATTPKSRIGWTLIFGLGFAVAGLLLRQPWGIHKNGGTPAWILFSMAITCVVYVLLYWIVNVKKITRGTELIAQAGSNTLLMYMLPYIFYSVLALFGIDFLQTHLSEGWTGVARSAVIAMFLMTTTVLLTRKGVRLKV